MDIRAIFGGCPCRGFMQRFDQALTWAAVNTSVDVEPSVASLTPSSSSPQFRACAPYIDDGLCVMHKACASSAWDNLLAVYKAANVKLSSTPGHISPPARILRALGFDVDCDSGTVAIPTHKVGEMVDLAKRIAARRSSTRHELKQLLGRLCRLIMIVRVGRRFIHRLLDLIRGPVQPRHAPLQLTPGALADLSWWLSHASSLNTKTFIAPSPLPLSSVFLTDGRGASREGPPSVGGLCHTARQFFSTEVPPELNDEPVHVVEAVVRTLQNLLK